MAKLRITNIHKCMDWKSVKFDWNRARAFLVTAEEGSLSAAARALDMTQPTLGRQVSALEKQLGVELPTPNQALPEDIEFRISRLVAPAAELALGVAASVVVTGAGALPLLVSRARFALLGTCS